MGACISLLGRHTCQSAICEQLHSIVSACAVRRACLSGTIILELAVKKREVILNGHLKIEPYVRYVLSQVQSQYWWRDAEFLCRMHEGHHTHCILVTQSPCSDLPSFDQIAHRSYLLLKRRVSIPLISNINRRFQSKHSALYSII